MSILGTGSVLPGRLVSTAEVAARAFPGRDPKDLEARTGIGSRWFHEGGETTASLAVRCLKAALDDAGLPATALRRVILTSSVGFDYTSPATVHSVIVGLGLRNTCDGFDLQNTCMGFLNAFDIAARCVATDLTPVAVVASELLSNYTDPSSPRPYVVMGDGGGAVILGRGAGGDGGDGGGGKSGVLGSHFGSDGAIGGSVFLAHQRPGAERELIRFNASNERITTEAVGAILESGKAALSQASLQTTDIDWFLIHQPNGVMFHKVAEALGAPSDRLIPIVHEVGSLASASIAISLDRLRKSGKSRPGQLVLFAGAASGLAYGAMIVRL